LIAQSRAIGALPILFPSGRGGINETQRIYELHLSIAREAPACVPPIPGLGLSLARQPDLVLHAPMETTRRHRSLLAAMIITQR